MRPMKNFPVSHTIETLFGTLPGIAVVGILTVVNALIFCLDAIAVAIAVNSSRITTDTARLPVNGSPEGV